MDRLWFYTKSGTTDKQGPIAEPALRNLVSNGSLGPQDLVWTEGMPEWKPLGAIPDLRAGIPATPMMGAALPDGLLGWMSFVAIMNIIGGIFLAVSCFGILNGVLQIVAGTALLAAKNALAGVGFVDAGLSLFFVKLKTFMQMTGIVFIIGLVGMLIFMVLWFTMFAAAFASQMNAL